MTELSATFVCAHCLQENEILIDVTEGSKQTLTEDCTICCCPNVLHIFVDEERGDVNVDAQAEE
ncbi:MAG: CPXCG motif-containing cysteine-rich protein [Ignavibacteriales bacterium]|nr:CPXCG motif-containing cysteine-rich protein [Ignavibacteriales bacterium]